MRCRSCIPAPLPHESVHRGRHGRYDGASFRAIQLHFSLRNTGLEGGVHNGRLVGTDNAVEIVESLRSGETISFGDHCYIVSGDAPATLQLSDDGDVLEVALG